MYFILQRQGLRGPCRDGEAHARDGSGSPEFARAITDSPVTHSGMRPINLVSLRWGSGNYLMAIYYKTFTPSGL